MRSRDYDAQISFRFVTSDLSVNGEAKAKQNEDKERQFVNQLSPIYLKLKKLKNSKIIGILDNIFVWHLPLELYNLYILLWKKAKLDTFH